jgi:hypothetical protein
MHLLGLQELCKTMDNIIKFIATDWKEMLGTKEEFEELRKEELADEIQDQEFKYGEQREEEI